MNERIQELEDQATDNILGVRVLDKKKFAQLIINDCCQVLSKWKGEPFPFDEDLAVSLIKEHFEIT